MRVLLLGGTTEATSLAARLVCLPGFAVTLSLAGVTAAARLPRAIDGSASSVTYRIGGFGGVDGLCAWLLEARIDLLVDATHPYATQITRHAREAAARLGLPCLRIERPPWQPQPGDRWTMVADAPAAAAALAATRGTVLLTVGTRSLAAFRNAGCSADGGQRRVIVRCIDPPNPALLADGAERLLARGPFTLESEQALLMTRQVRVLVSKNSGGHATEAKLTAARALGIAVILIDRPAPPAARTALPTVADALEWLLARRRDCIE